MADLTTGGATTNRKGCRSERNEPVHQAETGRAGQVLCATWVNPCALGSLAFEGADFVAQVPASGLLRA